MVFALNGCTDGKSNQTKEALEKVEKAVDEAKEAVNEGADKVKSNNN